MIYSLLNNPLTTGLFLIAFAFWCLLFVISVLLKARETNAGGSNVGEEGGEQ